MSKLFFDLEFDFDFVEVKVLIAAQKFIARTASYQAIAINLIVFGHQFDSD